MPRYRKKPVEIDAYQWLPADPETTGRLIGELMARGVDHRCVASTGASTVLAIETLEGTMTAQPGDWIVIGVEGEAYPVKPSIFAATYEAVSE